MELYVLYTDAGVYSFLGCNRKDAETHASATGLQLSSNTITVEDDAITYPQDVIVEDGVARLATEAEKDSNLQSIIAETKLAELRRERNSLLKETDWMGMSDVTPTAEQLAYRQALRDITETYTSLDDVVWPVKP